MSDGVEFLLSFWSVTLCLGTMRQYTALLCVMWCTSGSLKGPIRYYKCRYSPQKHSDVCICSHWRDAALSMCKLATEVEKAFRVFDNWCFWQLGGRRNKLWTWMYHFTLLWRTLLYYTTLFIHWGSCFWPPGELKLNNHSFSSLYVSTRESPF